MKKAICVAILILGACTPTENLSAGKKGGDTSSEKLRGVMYSTAHDYPRRE
jgi:hypothetical protein